MNLSDIVTKGKLKTPRLLMVHGIAGVGKSTFASGAPNCLFLPTEDGTEDLDVERLPRLTDLSEIKTFVDMIIGEAAQNTLVLDTADGLERIIWDSICTKHDISSIEELGYGRGYVEALNGWRWVLNQFYRLKDNGMDVVILAHSDMITVHPPNIESYTMWAPRLHKKAANLIIEWCDEVLFANFVVRTRETNQKKTQAVGKGERVLHCTPKPHYAAKNRLSMPDTLPLDWEAYQEFAGA